MFIMINLMLFFVDVALSNGRELLGRVLDTIAATARIFRNEIEPNPRIEEIRDVDEGADE